MYLGKTVFQNSVGRHSLAYPRSWIYSLFVDIKQQIRKRVQNRPFVFLWAPLTFSESTRPSYISASAVRSWTRGDLGPSVNCSRSVLHYWLSGGTAAESSGSWWRRSSAGSDTATRFERRCVRHAEYIQTGSPWRSTQGRKSEEIQGEQTDESGTFDLSNVSFGRVFAQAKVQRCKCCQCTKTWEDLVFSLDRWLQKQITVTARADPFGSFYGKTPSFFYVTNEQKFPYLECVGVT